MPTRVMNGAPAGRVKNVSKDSSMNRYQDIIRPVWAEIDLGAVRHNLSEIRRLIGPNVAVMAVVKAEAYGHGAVEVARAAIDCGAEWLGVSLPEEGIALRTAGIDAPILVFEPLQPEQAESMVRNNLTATLCIDEAVTELAQAALKIGKNATAHVKVDTGMGRVGIRPENAESFMKQASVPGITINGIYSHFATADEKDKEYALKQLAIFQGITKILAAQKMLPPYVHIANSAGIIELPESHLTMVRPGIILYGLYPSEAVDHEKIKLKPALALKTRVIFVKRVSPRTGISYGQKYHTDRETTVATIPIGYADGWSRLLSHKAYAVIRGKKFPIVGTICMDQCMVDVGEEPVVRGDEVVLIGTQDWETITADDVARDLGSINYEVTCMLSPRVPRVYMDSSQSNLK